MSVSKSGGQETTWLFGADLAAPLHCSAYVLSRDGPPSVSTDGTVSASQHTDREGYG
jgi:hypothetical protein